MRINQGNFRSTINGIITNDVMRKTVLLNTVCLTGIAFLLPMGLLAYFQHNYYLWIADWILAFFLAGNLFYLKVSGNLQHVIWVNIGFMMVFFFYLLSSGGVNNTAFMWYYVFPLFSLFLLGPQKGIFANLIFFIPSVCFLLFEPRILYFTTYSTDFKLRFIPSYLVVLAYSFIFEYMRKISHQNLDDRNSELEKVVAELIKAKKYLVSSKIAAENMSRAKSEFLANMSHELRTPLNHIIGFTELITGRNCGDINETQEEYLNDVLSSSRHLLSLINDILDLSKIEAGKMALNLAETPIRGLLANSLVMVKEKALKQGINLSLNIDEDTPDNLMGDERKLKQVMYNLLSNAVKFTPDGGQIVVGCAIRNGNGCPDSSADGKDLSVWVKDTGIGIEQHDLKRIFEPFEQVEGSTSRKFQGTGLGLSLTKKIVELHGGRIQVCSEGKDKGSIFEFTLPIRQKHESES